MAKYRGSLKFGSSGRQGGGNTDTFPMHNGVGMGPLNSGTPIKKTWDEAFETRDKDQYGKDDSPEAKARYIKEAKRQKASYEKTGKWDVGGKDKRTDKMEKMETIPPPGVDPKLSSEGTQESLVKDLPKDHPARIGPDAEKFTTKEPEAETKPEKKESWFDRNKPSSDTINALLNSVRENVGLPGNLPTDQAAKAQHSKMALEKHKVDMENVERNQIETDQKIALRKIRLDNLEKVENEGIDLDESGVASVDDEGNPALDPNAVSTAEKVGTQVTEEDSSQRTINEVTAEIASKDVTGGGESGGAYKPWELPGFTYDE